MSELGWDDWDQGMHRLSTSTDTPATMRQHEAAVLPGYLGSRPTYLGSCTARDKLRNAPRYMSVENTDVVLLQATPAHAPDQVRLRERGG